MGYLPHAASPALPNLSISPQGTCPVVDPQIQILTLTCYECAIQTLTDMA